MRELDVAIEAAREGGRIVAKYFREGVEIRSKASHDLVSDADVESEAAVASVIQRSLPGHQILAEENLRADANSEHLWIVDPLDGTNNFAHAIPHFAVSVAYYRAGEPICGVVHHPIRDEWYVASRGEGARLGDDPVHVADHRTLDQSLVGLGFYYDRGAMMEATLAAMMDLFRNHVHGVRRFGAASLDLCMVASGQFGAFFEYALAPWDFAAGRLFVEEAGGKVTTCSGNPLPIAKTSLLATNGYLHYAMMEVVGRHWND